MISVISHRGNANHNHSEAPLRRMAWMEMMDDSKCQRGCGETGTSYTAGGDVKWCSHCENRVGVPPIVKHRSTM